MGGYLDAYAKRDQAQMKTLLGVDLTLDQARQNWCDWMCVGVNHIVNGMCTLPLFVSTSPTSVHWALFVAGLMGEVAYDIFDMSRRWYEQLCTTEGTLGGWVAITLVTCHHPCSIFMAVPMLLFKPHNPDFHLMAFSLMLAGGIAILGGFGCQVLNIKNAAGLNGMRLISAVVASVVVWARVFVFFPTSWRLLALFHSELSGATMAAIAVLAVGMLIFNVFFVTDWVLKFVKAMQMTPEAEQTGKAKVEPEQLCIENDQTLREASDKAVRARRSQLTRQASFASGAA